MDAPRVLYVKSESVIARGRIAVECPRQFGVSNSGHEVAQRQLHDLVERRRRAIRASQARGQRVIQGLKGRRLQVGRSPQRNLCRLAERQKRIDREVLPLASGPYVVSASLPGHGIDDLEVLLQPIEGGVELLADAKLRSVEYRHRRLLRANPRDWLLAI